MFLLGLFDKTNKHFIPCRCGWKDHHWCSGKTKQRAEAENQGSLPAIYGQGKWIQLKSTRTQSGQSVTWSHAVHDSSQPLDAALKSALKGDLEDVVLSLLKTPAQYDADQLKNAMKVHRKKILSLMLTLVSVEDVMEHICSKSTDPTFICYFLCWMTSTHFHVLFCSKRTIWHVFFFFLKFGQRRVISVYSMCISL